MQSHFHRFLFPDLTRAIFFTSDASSATSWMLSNSSCVSRLTFFFEMLDWPRKPWISFSTNSRRCASLGNCRHRLQTIARRPRPPNRSFGRSLPQIRQMRPTVRPGWSRPGQTHSEFVLAGGVLGDQRAVPGRPGDPSNLTDRVLLPDALARKDPSEPRKFVRGGRRR